MVASVPEAVNKHHFTDWHCHLLPGLDDGPEDIREAVGMANILTVFGFTDVCCTPHLRKGVYDNCPEKVRDAAAGFQALLTEQRIALRIHSGIEYHLDEYLLDSLARPLTLHANHILVEAHQHVQTSFLTDMMFQIAARKGLQPILAHPERYDLFDDALSTGKHMRRAFMTPWSGRPFRLFPRGRQATDCQPYASGFAGMLHSMGCLFQGNIGSFAGIYGENVKQRAMALLKQGFYHRLGTDAHRLIHLDRWLEKGFNAVEREVGKEGLARLLEPWDTEHPANGKIELL